MVGSSRGVKKTNGNDALIGPLLREALRGAEAPEATFICEELQRKGLLRTYVIAGSRQDVPIGDFIQNFWDYDNSPYVKEKLRKNHSIHRNYARGQRLSAGRRNIVLKAGTIPLRWAFAKEIIDKDITNGITWFSGKTAERQILSPEIVRAVFRVEWQNFCHYNFSPDENALKMLKATGVIGWTGNDVYYYIMHHPTWRFMDLDIKICAIND